jgi:Uma2 family endonuclease
MTPLISEPEVHYPDSDGMPMADNMLQFEWIVTIQGNLDLLFANDANVLVAGDNLIYPVKGQPTICLAPDVYVAFGRPKGYRGSYKVWAEGDVFPQVVFEVLSPNNTAAEMTRKRQFYEKHGAEEFYILDPDLGTLEGHVRGPAGLTPVADMEDFKSPRLGITFSTRDRLEIRYPGGSRFLTFVELGQLQKATAREAAEEKRRVESERQRAEQEKQRAEQERQRAEKLAARLRELGVDPDA